MLQGIQKGVSRLSISGKSKSLKKTEKSKPRIPEKWVYGYLVTNRFIIRFAEEHGLPWKTDSGLAFLAAQIHVRNESGIPLRVECLPYRGRTTTVIVFVEDDHRKRLNNLDYSDEEIDRVRAALELPEGTEPTWYDFYGNYPEDTEFDSEDDIDWEDEYPPPSESMVETFAKNCIFVDLDELDELDRLDELDELEEMQDVDEEVTEKGKI